jgi:uncharacterized repeat protein (TIGR03803 family)
MKIVAAVMATLAVMATVLAASPSTWAPSKERVLHSFKGTDGGGLPGGVIFDSAGNLYGTTQAGSGTHIDGTVFELIPGAKGGWTEKVLHTFHSKDGWQPLTGLVLDTAGNLYGTTSLGGSAGEGGDGTVFELTSGGNGRWTEKVLHSFSGTDGIYPAAGLIFDTAGNLYGTTKLGGAGSACQGGCGVVFELSPGADDKWTEKVLHSFKGTDGRLPAAGLIFDQSGNLYGTTQLGGTATACQDGCGVVFELSPGVNGKWTEKVLHSFKGTDGSDPEAGLIFDGVGNLYGTTLDGGTYGYGAVIEMMPQADRSWTVKVLHSFNNDGKDGRYPQAVLIFDSAGNLYGTTAYGGTGTGCSGQFALCGTVFELTPGGKGRWTEKILHSFVGNGKDGVGPEAGLILDVTGNLYSTTAAGGAGLGLYGTVFEVAP